MKFFKEIGLIVLFLYGGFICRDEFEFGVLISQIFVEESTILCEFVYIPHANAFIKCSFPTQLYGIEKRIWKEYGYKTYSKEDKNGFVVY